MTGVKMNLSLDFDGLEVKPNYCPFPARENNCSAIYPLFKLRHSFVLATSCIFL